MACLYGHPRTVQDLYVDLVVALILILTCHYMDGWCCYTKYSWPGYHPDAIQDRRRPAPPGEGLRVSVKACWPGRQPAARLNGPPSAPGKKAPEGITPAAPLSDLKPPFMPERRSDAQRRRSRLAWARAVPQNYFCSSAVPASTCRHRPAG